MGKVQTSIFSTFFLVKLHFLADLEKTTTKMIQLHRKHNEKMKLTENGTTGRNLIHLYSTGLSIRDVFVRQHRHNINRAT